MFTIFVYRYEKRLEAEAEMREKRKIEEREKMADAAYEAELLREEKRKKVEKFRAAAKVASSTTSYETKTTICVPTFGYL